MHFLCKDRESFASVASACCFDTSVQGKQVCLKRYFFDNTYDVGDFLQEFLDGTHSIYSSRNHPTGFLCMCPRRYHEAKGRTYCGAISLTSWPSNVNSRAQ